MVDFRQGVLICNEMEGRGGKWNQATYYVNFVGFRLFQLVSLYIRWAPVASKPSVGYNFDWARHLWDTSGISAFSLSHSLFVFLVHSLSLSAWGWGHLVYVCGARHADWSRCGPGQSVHWNTTHFVYCLVLATEPGWSPSAEHFTFGTLLIYTCTDELHSGRGVASWIKLSYQNISGEIICFSVHVSASFSCVGGSGGGGGGRRRWGLRSNCENVSEEISGGVWTMDSLAGKQEAEERPPDFSPAMCGKKKESLLLPATFSPLLSPAQSVS